MTNSRKSLRQAHNRNIEATRKEAMSDNTIETFEPVNGMIVCVGHTGPFVRRELLAGAEKRASEAEADLDRLAAERDEYDVFLTQAREQLKRVKLYCSFLEEECSAEQLKSAQAKTDAARGAKS